MSKNRTTYRDAAIPAICGVAAFIFYVIYSPRSPASLAESLFFGGFLFSAFGLISGVFSGARIIVKWLGVIGPITFVVLFSFLFTGIINEVTWTRDLPIMGTVFAAALIGCTAGSIARRLSTTATLK
jgi:hypothetical protein